MRSDLAGRIVSLGSHGAGAVLPRPPDGISDEEVQAYLVYLPRDRQCALGYERESDLLEWHSEQLVLDQFRKQPDLPQIPRRPLGTTRWTSSGQHTPRVRRYFNRQRPSSVP
jgi:hypothetical protein